MVCHPCYVHDSITANEYSVDDFVRNLLQLPAEPEMLSDAVYANSQTLDGRRFAEEFVRRRKQADRGVAPESNAPLNFNSGSAGGGESKAGGGWSEVAKKGPVTQEKSGGETAAFKVVAPKKKGKR
jgi:PERQ amino acid-rich with GYF domain-containing protein